MLITLAELAQLIRFDEPAVRGWLDNDDDREEIAGLDDEPETYPRYQDDAQVFVSAVDELVTAAAAGGLLGVPPHVEVFVTPTCDTEGDLDGAIISVQVRPDDTRPAVRFATWPLDLDDLIDDTEATGVDAAVGILSAVTATAARLLREATVVTPQPLTVPPAAHVAVTGNADGSISVTGPFPTDQAANEYAHATAGDPDLALDWTAVTQLDLPPDADLPSTLAAARGLRDFGVADVRLTVLTGSLRCTAEANVHYRTAGHSMDGVRVRGAAADPDGAIRALDATIRRAFRPGGTDPFGLPCALDATTEAAGHAG